MYITNKMYKIFVIRLAIATQQPDVSADTNYEFSL